MGLCGTLRGRNRREVGFMQHGQSDVKPGSLAEVGFMQNAERRRPPAGEAADGNIFSPTSLRDIGI